MGLHGDSTRKQTDNGLHQDTENSFVHGPVTAGSPFSLFYLKADPAYEKLCVFQPEKADYVQNFSHD